jgi:uncharacterized protein YbjT (DUF2867 family)
MSTGKRVLVLGASGMIGRAIQDAARDTQDIEMVPATHRHIAGHVHVDYESLTTASDWAALLQAQRIRAVVNCVGIWKGTTEEFERVQYTVPVALFDACAALRIRVVHISALGFSVDSPLPYASTKARADQYLLAHCANGVVIYPSLVFGSDGNSTRFFLALAALPLQVDFGFARNLQPVHVGDVAGSVMSALTQDDPARIIECAGQHPIGVGEYFDALRSGMGLAPVHVKVKLPRWCGKLLFDAGEMVGSRFVNHQTWVLLEAGTSSQHDHPHAMPYASYATSRDRQMTQDTQLYWLARISIAFIWLWTSIATFFMWPRAESMSWLDSLWQGLGTSFWLTMSCALDAGMGIASVFWPSRRLWQAQLALTSIYTIGLAIALPWSWAHPFGPLTKNLAVLCTMLFLLHHEARRTR